VTALDASAARVRRLKENLTRTGHAAEVVVADARGWEPGRAVGAILVDAPCSATGTIRRHPDLPFVRGPADLPALTAFQARLLARAWDWLAPGGRLVYCTCSLLPEEGEAQAARFRAAHPQAEVVAPEVAGLETGWVDGHGGLRLRPDFWAERGGMDGFYAVALTKPAVAA
jgi:16S rRNA (cytosine967-C5)-methyltransferase